MTVSKSQELQALATIAKTTPTAVGGEIDTSNAVMLTLYMAYVNGDETGLNIYVYELHETGGTVFQDNTWTDASGTVTAQVNTIYLGTATVNRQIVIDVSNINWIVVKQGGSDDDGTPTGTLAMDYTLTR